MLSDGTILRLVNDGTVVITPRPVPSAFQPASVDLCLGDTFLLQGSKNEHHITARAEPFWLPPGRCALATTLETITLPDHIVARVEGKSTWGRRFLMVHSTAGFIDPGFTGQITLELANISPRALRLYPAERIAQISFEYLDAPAQRPYGSPGLGSKYQGQTGATGPRG